MKTNAILLIIGAIMFWMGVYQFSQYEESIIVQATITDIKSVESGDDYKHIYYGKYTVDGKTYKNKKLDTAYTDDFRPSKLVGDKIELHIDPENPGEQTAEGGFFGMLGLALAIWNGIALHKKNTARADNS